MTDENVIEFERQTKVSQEALKTEISIAHANRVNVIAEAVILKVTDLISHGASPKKINQMLDVLDRLKK